MFGLAALAQCLFPRRFYVKLIGKEVQNGLRVFVGKVELTSSVAASFDRFGSPHCIGFELHGLANEELSSIELGLLGQRGGLYSFLYSTLLIPVDPAADGAILLHAYFLERLIDMQHSLGIRCDLRDHILQLPSVLLDQVVSAFQALYRQFPALLHRRRHFLVFANRSGKSMIRCFP